ncbi:MAG: TIR domain-containing protein [Armatimonadota bacterium]
MTERSDHREDNADEEFMPRRIFLSYGHDQHAELAVRLKADLEKRGHKVWFDLDRLKPGGDWEAYIEEGIEWVCAGEREGRVILLMTPHSVRRPDGYCLNEVARALSRSLSVVPVMLVECEPPLSICRIQWLDMQDCIPVGERQERYETRRDRLMKALEQDRLDFEGVQSRLLTALKPLPFDADIDRHLERFTGREWVFEAIDEWLREPNELRTFWLQGAPGVGKTAISAWLCRNRREVAAFHLCRHGHQQKADPRATVTSIAYQLSTQLPDYQDRLGTLDLGELVAESDAKTLFDRLIAQPLSQGFPAPDRPIIILIDGLDEATADGRNDLAWFISTEWRGTPQWLRLIVTSRPEPEVTHPLQGLSPHVLDASEPRNEDDIRRFLRGELRAFTGCEATIERATEAIVEKSEGIFLYVEWVRQELAGGRLSLDRLDEFPQGLGQVYAEFFRRQFRDEREFAETIRPALEIVAAAREPLQVSEIAEMLDWDQYAEDDFIDGVGALLSTEDGVRPFHRSVMDWLTDRERAGRYRVSEKKGHERLAGFGWGQYEAGVDALSEYMVTHLPHHLMAAELWEELETLLTDLFWLERKAEAGMVFDLTTDLTAAYHSLPTDRPWARNMRLIDQALRNDLHFIARRPTTLFQCLWNSAWWYDCDEAANHYDPLDGGWGPQGPPWEREEPRLSTLLERWREEKEERQPGFVWIRSLRPPPQPLGGAQIMCLHGHEKPVNSVAVSPDGQRIVSGSSDNTVRVWDANSGEELACLRGHEAWVTSVTFCPDGCRVVSGSGDKTVRVWDADNGEELACLRGHDRRVSSVTVSPDGCRIVSGSFDTTLRVWDADTGEELLCFSGHDERVRSVAFSPKGTLVSSAGGNVTGSGNSVRIWDTHTGDQIGHLDGHEDCITCVGYSQDGSRLISASWDGTVRIWDVTKLEQLSVITHENAVVLDASFSPDGRMVVSGASDHTARICDATSDRRLTASLHHGDWVNCTTWFPDGSRVISATGTPWGPDNTIRIWDATQTAQTPRPQGPVKDWVRATSVSPDERRVVTGCDDETVGLWDTSTGLQIGRMTGHSGPVLSVDFSNDGRLVVSASSDSTIRVWCVERLTEILRIRCFQLDALEGVCFSSDDRQVVVRADGAVHMHDAATGKSSGNACTVSARDSSTKLATLLSCEAILGDSETVVYAGASDYHIAWLSTGLHHISGRPSGSLWAGAIGPYLAIIKLEGEPETAASF